MNKANKRIGRTPAMVAVVGLGLASFESGCAGLTGLRSVAPDRPSVLGFWEKPSVGSPTPGTDHYAQNIRAEQNRAGREPKAADSPLMAQANALDPLDESSPAESPAGGKQSQQSSIASNSTNLPRGGRVYVTLGRPEPLPALALDAQSRKLASTTPSSSWRPERSPSRSEPAERDNARFDQAPELALAAPVSASPKEAPEPSKTREGHAILAQADAKLRGLKTYKMKVSRVERVGGQLQPSEELSLFVRSDPKAVRLEWADGPNKGREVIYSSTLDPRMIFVHMANSAIPLPSMKIAIDSPLVMKNSRHSITEAGLDTIVEKLRRAEQNGGDSDKEDKLEFRGLQKAPGLDHPCNQFVIRSATGDSWKIFLDPNSKLPCLVIGEDQRGELIERYVYRDITANPADLALAEAFDPDKRWGDSKGLLSRLARAATGSDLPANSQLRTR